MLREVNQSAAADVRFGLGRVVTALAFTWIILSMVQGLASFSLKGSWSFFFFRILFFFADVPYWNRCTPSQRRLPFVVLHRARIR